MRIEHIPQTNTELTITTQWDDQYYVDYFFYAIALRHSVFYDKLSC